MKVVLDIETVAAPINEWAALVGLDIVQVESDFANFGKDYQKSVFDGTFSRIVCIGVLTLQDDSASLNAIAWYGDDEKAISGRSISEEQQCKAPEERCRESLLSMADDY